MGRTIGLGRIWSFVLGFRSLVARLAPFKRELEQRGRFFWQRKVGTHCEFQRHNGDHFRKERQEVWREKRRVRIFGKGKCEVTAIVRIFGMGKCKLIANFSAKMMTSLPSISLSLCISLSLSLSLSPSVPPARYRKRFRASYNRRKMWSTLWSVAPRCWWAPFRPFLPGGSSPGRPRDLEAAWTGMKKTATT